MFLSVLFTGLVLAGPNYHGATLSFYGEHVHGSGTYDARLKHLAESGGRSVSFLVSWQLEDIRSNRVHPYQQQSKTDAVLRRAIRSARRLGLTVMLMPVIDLNHTADGEWRGRLTPNEPNVFWQSYGRFLSRYARLAQREGVSILSVGSELSSLEQELGRWRALITQIRTEYSGSLIYSANWDHFQHVPFWALLDYVGISGYFELTKDSKATSEELTNAWWKIRTVILDWLSQYTRPLIFTELGYPSRDGGAVYPWDYTRKAVIDLEEQRRALAAFKAVWATEERLHGVYFWNWWGPDDGRNSWYTIPGKPGLSEVVEYFRLRSLR